jgi:hypothetical protein
MPEPQSTPPYDRDAIFRPDAPINPGFVCDAVHTLFRALPIDPAEPKPWADRRLHGALLSLSALHPRDEIELMLGIQAIAAHHAAAASFRLGMNLTGGPNGHAARHISAGCSAARTFDSILRALERRQAKPLAIPQGRPAPRSWDDAPDPAEIIHHWEETIRAAAAPPDPTPPRTITWTEDGIAAVHAAREQDRIAKENEGLDIASTEGILPGGGMIMPEDPTPQQQAYIGRRLGLMYKREIERNRRRGITTLPRIRGIRPGDLIP